MRRILPESERTASGAGPSTELLGSAFGYARAPAVLALLVCVGLFALQCSAQPQKTRRILALVYGKSQYPAHLASRRAANTNERINMVWMFFLVQAGNRSLLIDSGFDDPVARRRFGLQEFTKPAELLRRAGIDPNAIEDIILTHGHFDHADGMLAFPKARVHIHELDLALLQKRLGPTQLRRRSNRLQTFASPTQIGPLEIEPVGGHTAGSSAVQFKKDGQRYLFVGDECYLVRDCTDGLPLPRKVAWNPSRNADFVRQIQRESMTEQLVVLPAHDPQIIRGAKKIAPGVFELR